MTNKEFEQDLSKIDSELESRRLDLAKIETRREIMAQIREVQEKEEADYQKLLKEREECKAEINGLADKREFVNGALGPVEEQHKLEQELEKMNASIAKFDKLREQHKNDLNEHTAVIEELLKKYNIREKYKSELHSEQDVPAPETKQPEEAKSIEVPSEENKETTPVIDDTQKDNKTEQVETITVEGPAENEQPHKETDTMKRIKGIYKRKEEKEERYHKKIQKEKIKQWLEEGKTVKQIFNLLKDSGTTLKTIISVKGKYSKGNEVLESRRKMIEEDAQALLKGGYTPDEVFEIIEYDVPISTLKQMNRTIRKQEMEAKDGIEH